MARAAGNRTARGIEGVARTIKGLMDDEGVSYLTASGRMMIAADEIWDDDEHRAIREAFEDLLDVGDYR